MCAYENRPVRKSARAGIVGNDEITWWSKTTDSAAKRSRFGVRIVRLPYAPRWSRRKVSETICTMFGRSAVIRVSFRLAQDDPRVEREHALGGHEQGIDLA